jgi:hypothetical protein
MAMLGHGLANMHGHTSLHIRDTYWYRWFQAHHLLEKPRSIQTRRRYIQVHTDATPNALGLYILSTPPHAIHQPLDPPLPIAEAYIAAALHAFLVITETYHQPVHITLYTDSTVAFYTLSSGKGLTFRQSPLLQKLYVLWIRVNRGFSLVVRWIPSQANLDDPVSRGVSAQIT